MTATTATSTEFAGAYAPAVLDAGVTERCVVCKEHTTMRGMWWFTAGNRPSGVVVAVCPAEMDMSDVQGWA